MEINIQEILTKHGIPKVARNKFRFAIKEILEITLKKAADSAEIELRIYNSKGEYRYENLGQEIASEREKEYYGTSKESITSTINKIKF